MILIFLPTFDAYCPADEPVQTRNVPPRRILTFLENLPLRRRVTPPTVTHWPLCFFWNATC